MYMSKLSVIGQLKNCYSANISNLCAQIVLNLQFLSGQLYWPLRLKKPCVFSINKWEWKINIYRLFSLYLRGGNVIWNKLPFKWNARQVPRYSSTRGSVMFPRGIHVAFPRGSLDSSVCYQRGDRVDVFAGLCRVTIPSPSGDEALEMVLLHLCL